MKRRNMEGFIKIKVKPHLFSTELLNGNYDFILNFHAMKREVFVFVFQINMKSECQPLTFTSYIKYNEYKFFSRQSHDEFVTFIANYEQLKVEMEEDIDKTYSRSQLSVLDLLSASNLATEDVEQILNSNHETDSPEDLYKAVKISVQEIAEALSNLDGDGANDSSEDGANNVTEDDFSINQNFDDAKEEIRETLNTIKEDEKGGATLNILALTIRLLKHTVSLNILVEWVIQKL